MITTVEANTEIVNFGPIMCRADESGHLEDKAARDVSANWTILRPSSEPRLFSITPTGRTEVDAKDDEQVVSHRGAWFTLQLVDPAQDQVALVSEPSSTNTAAHTQESRVAAADLATEAFPLLVRGHDRDITPRDRFAAEVWNHTMWWLTRRYTLRASWPANVSRSICNECQILRLLGSETLLSSILKFPNSIHIDVHTPRTMLEKGKIKWAAKGKKISEQAAVSNASLEENNITEANESRSNVVEGSQEEDMEETLAENHQDPEWLERDADTPFWPCPRLYVHVYSTADGVPIPGPPSKTEEGRTQLFPWALLEKIAEMLMGALQNAEQLPVQRARKLEGIFMSSSEDDKEGKRSPMPFHITLEPLDLVAVPRTAWSLLVLLVPAITLVWNFGVPFISKRVLADLRPREKTE